MTSHRITPSLDVQLRRTFRPLARAFAMLGKSISEAGALTRDDYTLTASLADEPVTPLWSPDPPSVPAGHVWTLPGIGTSKLDRALWWGEPRSVKDNVHVACLANARRYEPIPGWKKPPTPKRVRIFDRDGALIGESGEPELITSQSAEDQRAHEEDA